MGFARRGLSSGERLKARPRSHPKRARRAGLRERGVVRPSRSSKAWGRPLPPTESPTEGKSKILTSIGAQDALRRAEQAVKRTSSTVEVDRQQLINLLIDNLRRPPAAAGAGERAHAEHRAPRTARGDQLGASAWRRTSAAAAVAVEPVAGRRGA
jgi:hypothetical protein